MFRSSFFTTSATLQTIILQTTQTPLYRPIAITSTNKQNNFELFRNQDDKEARQTYMMAFEMAKMP